MEHQFTLVGVKQDASYFENKEPVLIYIGKKLRDSLRLEEIFTAANVDYGVEADEYRGGVIFRSVRTGAFFYVLPECGGNRARSHAAERLPAVPGRAAGRAVTRLARASIPE
jgi:hypothetical protein